MSIGITIQLCLQQRDQWQPQQPRPRPRERLPQAVNIKEIGLVKIPKPCQTTSNAHMLCQYFMSVLLEATTEAVSCQTFCARTPSLRDILQWQNCSSSTKRTDGMRFSQNGC